MISFTGGEPTVRTDLPKLVSRAVAEGLRVNLITYGTLMTEPLAAELKASGLASAQVSLEGPEEEIHDGLTGVPGSFRLTLRGLEALKKVGVPVHTNTTLNSRNVGSAARMPILAKSLGMTRLSMNLIIPSAWLKENNPDLLLTYSVIGAHVLAIREAARKAQVRFLWYSPTPYCLFNPIAHRFGNKGCAACDGLLSIDPQGQIIPCSSFLESQGSLRNESFQNIWNSASAKRLREKAHAPEGCQDCDRFELCEGACPLYWNVMGSSEIVPVHECCTDLVIPAKAGIQT